MRSRAWQWVVVFAALCLTTANATAQHRHHNRKSKPHHSGNPSQLRSKLDTIRIQKAKLRRQLRETKHQAHVVVEDIHAVDSKLETVKDQLDQTTNHLSDSRSEQQILAKRLVAAVKRLGEVRAQVRHRLRMIYMNGDSTFLSAVAGTRTVDDIVSEHTLMEAIARKDHSMFDEFVQLKRDVAGKKRRQDELVAEIKSLKARQARQKLVLDDTREEKRIVLGGLRQRETDLQQQMAQFDADEASISDEIAAFARRSHQPGQPVLPQFVGRFLKPAQGPITSGFGMRYHPVLHYTRIHKGIDFGAPYGSAIVAAADGVVITAKYSSSFGNMIIIAHGGNLSTVYAHCSRLYVSTGQTVRRGQRIGAVGSTGLAKGPHLHWEVHVGGTAVNPIGRF